MASNRSIHAAHPKQTEHSPPDQQEQRNDEVPISLNTLAQQVKFQPHNLPARTVMQLQRLIGNRATQRLLGSAPQPTASNHAHIQRVLRIVGGEGQGTFPPDNKVAVLNPVLQKHASAFGITKPGDVVNPLNALINDPNGIVYEFNDVYEALTYMVTPGAIAPQAQQNNAPPQPVVPQVPQLEITYDAEHGGYHFGGNPTNQKTKWSLDVDTARDLMRERVDHYAEVMATNSSQAGTTTWYIGTFHRDDIGFYREGSDFLPTSGYTIQVAVKLSEGKASFHGYPDERLLKEGLGRSKNQIRDDW
jgi:hypothetical protein